MKLSTTQLKEILTEIIGEVKPEELILSRFREHSKDNPDLLSQLFNLQWWSLGPWEVDPSLFGITESDASGSYKDLMLLKFFRDGLSHNLIDRNLNEERFIEFFHNNDGFQESFYKMSPVDSVVPEQTKNRGHRIFIIESKKYELNEIICRVMWPLFMVSINQQKHNSSSPHLMEIALLYYIEGSPITPTNWEAVARNAAFRFNLSKTPSKKIYYNYLDIQRRDNQSPQLFKRAKALAKDEELRKKVDKNLAEYLEWKRCCHKGKAIK